MRWMSTWRGLHCLGSIWPGRAAQSMLICDAAQEAQDAVEAMLMTALALAQLQLSKSKQQLRHALWLVPMPAAQADREQQQAPAEAAAQVVRRQPAAQAAQGRWQTCNQKQKQKLHKQHKQHTCKLQRGCGRQHQQEEVLCSAAGRYCRMPHPSWLRNSKHIPKASAVFAAAGLAGGEGLAVSFLLLPNCSIWPWQRLLSVVRSHVTCKLNLLIGKGLVRIIPVLLVARQLIARQPAASSNSPFELNTRADLPGKREPTTHHITNKTSCPQARVCRS